MSVFWAMLVDSYRELNSKKLFWVTLFLSLIVVVFYASIGFNETGMFMFFGLTSFENEMLNQDSPLARILYRGIFSTFIVGFWLAWIATILALISTTTIFPDFVAEGSVEIVLSKPIRRLQIFLYKYLTSLLFVVLQVGLFCLGIFLCMGWRLGDWNWIVFAAVPLITIFFTYLFCVNVFIGVVTRSSLAALLLTMLFWFGLFSLNTTEVQLNLVRTSLQHDVDGYNEQIETQQAALDQLPEDDPGRARIQINIDNATQQRDDQDDILGKVMPWYTGVRVGQACLPKTSETIGLLDRWLKEDTDVNLIDVMAGNVTMDDSGGFRPSNMSGDRAVQQDLQEDYEGRSLWYIMGTSLLFELVLLGAAAWVFVRRDY